MTTPPVTTERSGSVLSIHLHRPEARNAVDGPTAAALLQAFQAFEADDALRVAVLHGQGAPSAPGPT